MDHVSVKNLLIPYSARLTEKKDEQNAWVAISRTSTLNVILVKLINADAPVQHIYIEGLNCVTLQHSKGICLTTYQCLLDAILELARHEADSGKPTGFSARANSSYTAPGMYHTVIV